MVSLRFPSFFVCFLIFIAWMHYKKRKATKQQEKESSLFWEREEEANHTRNKDISHLPLFTPDITRMEPKMTRSFIILTHCAVSSNHQ